MRDWFAITQRGQRLANKACGLLQGTCTDQDVH